GAFGFLGAKLFGLAIAPIPDPAIRWWVQMGLVGLTGLGGVVAWVISLELDGIERDWLFRRREVDFEDEDIPVRPVKAAKPVTGKRKPVEADDRPPPVISVPDKRNLPEKRSGNAPVQTSFDLRDR